MCAYAHIIKIIIPGFSQFPLSFSFFSVVCSYPSAKVSKMIRKVSLNVPLAFLQNLERYGLIWDRTLIVCKVLSVHSPNCFSGHFLSISA